MAQSIEQNLILLPTNAFPHFARLVEALAHDPEAVFMLATDAVYSTRPLPLDVGDGLDTAQANNGSIVNALWATQQ